MINVRGIANAAIQQVNPNIAAQYIKALNFTTDAAGVQTPTYAASATVQIQAQAATGKDLKHVEKINMQSVYKNVRMFGDAQGVVRAEAKGGDLFQFPNVPGGPVHVWLVLAVVETWPTWCSVLAVMQAEVPA